MKLANFGSFYYGYICYSFARNSSTPNNEIGDDENEARLLNKELLQEAERKYDELSRVYTD